MSLAAQALTEAADKGVQVGSMSFGVPDECPFPPDQTGSGAVCQALNNYTNREIAFTAASGNNLAEVELPARHIDVVAVGAVATEGTHWDRRNRPEGCPTPPHTSYPPLWECGSNYSLDPDRETTWANGQVRGPRNIPVLLNR